MNSKNPIEIPDDDDQMQKLRQQKQDEQNKSNILKATMSPTGPNRFQIIIAVLKIDMDGTEEQKDLRIKNRIQKFFDYGDKKINLSKHEHFYPRKEIEGDSELVENELVMYGVDFMSNRRIKQLFPHSEPRIKWMDDSHCKLIFQDAESAKEAITKNLRDAEAYKVKMEEETDELPRNWFELNPYYELGFQRALFCRYACSNEDETIVKSKYFNLFVQAKKKFEEGMVKQIQPAFEKHVRRLGLTSILSKNRTTRASFRSDNNERGFQRSREKRGMGRNRYEDEDDKRNSRGYCERDGFRRNRRGNLQDINQENIQLSFSSEKRNERKRNYSSAQPSLQLDDNFSYFLEADPEEQARKMQEAFERFAVEEGENNISVIAKNDEAQQIDPVAQNLNLSLQFNSSLNRSNFSMGRPHEEKSISFSYNKYIEEQDQEEERQKKLNISQIVID